MKIYSCSPGAHGSFPKTITQTEQLCDEKTEVFIQQNMLLCNLNTLFLRHRLQYTHQLQLDWPGS